MADPVPSLVSGTTTPMADQSKDNIGEVVGGIVLSVWILFSNLTLILAILRSEHRRTVSFNLHVCNLCLVSLLMGCLVLPLYVDFCLRNTWVHSDNLCRIWLMADMTVCTVSILVVAMMIFDRFVLFSCPEAAEGGCKYVFCATLIVLPWVIGAGFIIPIYLFGETGQGIHEDRGICFLHMSNVFAIVSELGGYAVPGLVAFALLVATSLTWCVKREELREMDYSEEREHKGWQVFTSWIVCLSVLGMWFPFSALHFLTALMDYTWPASWLKFAIWLAYANAGATPLLWMTMPRLRQSVRYLCCCCCRKRHHDIFDDDDETNTAMIEFHEKRV